MNGSPVPTTVDYAQDRPDAGSCATLASAPLVRRGMDEEALRWTALIALTLGCAVLGPRWGASDAAMAVILAAAAVSSIAGFAFSMICGALLFHIVPSPVQAVQIMIVCSIANQAAMTWALRRDVNWRGLGVFLTGGLLGVPMGAWLLIHADRVSYTKTVGVFLLTYGLWMLLRRPMTLRFQHPALDFCSGVLGGVTGGTLGSPGAPVAIWGGFKGWDKTRQRALFQPFILLMQIAAILTISLAKPWSAADAGFDPRYLLCIPASLLGTAIGMRLFHRLSDTQFARAVNVMLIVSGLGYVL